MKRQHITVILVSAVALCFSGLAGATYSEAGLQRRLSPSDPAAFPRPVLDAAESAVDAAKLCARRKMYANACDIYSCLVGGPQDAVARRELTKLKRSRAAVEAMLECGVDIQADGLPVPEFSDPPARPFVDAWVHKSDNYTVETNIGEDFAAQVAAAMEQMNRQYRKVFQHKRRGGGTARCTIRVYASRAGFEAHEGGHKKTVRGFYSHSKLLVATYDPRSDGRDFDYLWSTLFHEASHQFTRMISTGTIPGWLNEGTASYFEGARLLPTGRVSFNGIPGGRLRALVAGFGRGGPPLVDVLSYFEPGSYDVSYYPVGWGLVYFMHNYEDEESERVYLPLYRKYLKTYKSGGKHDPVERFVEYFIEKADQPDVANLEEFDARFRSWIAELHDQWRGGRSGQSKLLAKARKQRDDGALEAAVETYAWIIENGSQFAEVWLEYADVLAELDRADGALLAYRRAYGVASDDGQVTRGHVAERMGRINRTLGQELTRVADEMLSVGESSADALMSDGQFDLALAVLDHAVGIAGHDAELRSMRDRVARRLGNEGVSVSRRR